jgi:2-iminobutanoate/2-iminopropanoate deaminase
VRPTVFLLLVAVLATASACAEGRRAVWPAGAKPGGPYSPGVLVGDTLHVSGQVGRDPTTGEFPEAFGDETRLCLERVGLVLRAGGMDFEDVVSVQVFLADIDQFQQMNDVYRTFFTKAPLPARTTTGAARLPGGKARVEIAVIARR